MEVDLRWPGPVPFASLLATVGSPAIAEQEADHVLVLYSKGRVAPRNVEGDRGLHQTVRVSTDHPVTLSYEFLDAPRFGGPAFDEVVSTYLREQYAARSPRVILAVSEEALAFLLRLHAELFRGPRSFT